MSDAASSQVLRETGRTRLIDRLRVLSQLFKLRIGGAITLCAIAGMAVTPGEALPFWKTVVLALSVLLASASAGAFNQYAERILDARMRRTANRPFVTGVYRPGPHWLAVIGLVLLLGVGGAAWTLNAYVALYVFLGAFVYGVVYTLWLKQRTAWNIVIGGLAGSFAVLAGAAAITPDLAPTAIILALVLFLWTPPHFWSLAIILHKDYAAARVPMLPVVIGDAAAAKVILLHTMAVVMLSLLPVLFGMGIVYLAGAVIGGVIFLRRSIELTRDPSPAAASRNFGASLLQLGLLLLATIVDGPLHLPLI
jgi:protoheme IX farnesyltransferase